MKRNHSLQAKMRQRKSSEAISDDFDFLPYFHSSSSLTMEQAIGLFEKHGIVPATNGNAVIATTATTYGLCPDITQQPPEWHVYPLLITLDSPDHAR